MGIGVALLPRRCALTEIARGQLVADESARAGRPRQVRLVFRRTRRTLAAPRTPFWRSSKASGDLYGADGRDADVGQRDFASNSSNFEQQAGGVPTAVEERLARGGRQRRSGSDCPAAVTRIGSADRRRLGRTDPARPSSSALQRLRRRRRARHSQRNRVPEEDLRERLPDHRANPATADRLRRVLARRAAAEVGVDEQDRRATGTRGSRPGACPRAATCCDRPRRDAARAPRS